jgi:hypothetical protein
MLAVAGVLNLLEVQGLMDQKAVLHSKAAGLLTVIPEEEVQAGEVISVVEGVPIPLQGPEVGEALGILNQIHLQL